MRFTDIVKLSFDGDRFLRISVKVLPPGEQRNQLLLGRSLQHNDIGILA